MWHRVLQAVNNLDKLKSMTYFRQEAVRKSYTGRKVFFKKTLFFCLGEYVEYGFDQQMLIWYDMVCLSPVGYGV